MSIASTSLLLLAGAAASHNDQNNKSDGDNDRAQRAYSNQVLVSNGAIPAAFTDPNLVNGKREEASDEEEEADEEEQGAGLGIVNVFDLEGHLIDGSGRTAR